MANKKIKGITIQIGADTTGLDTALNGIEKKSKGTKSELAEVNRALKKAPESAELWKQKQELLAKAIQDSRDKVKLLEDAQEQVNQQFKDSKIGEEQYRAFKRELEYAKAEVGRFEGELESLNKTAGSASEDVKNLGDSADNTAGDVKALGDSADNTADNVKDLGESADSAGEKAENSGDGFTILKGTIADLAADGIRAAIDGFKELAAEGDTALNILQTKTGATAEQMEDYRQIMNNLYSNNYGDNRGDVANSIAEVKQQLGDISAEQLEKVTETALLLRDTFDFDVNESIRSAKMLMQQFELSADEAYTLIAQGAQSGLNKNGDLMDVINEYSVHYKQMGYSAEEFFNSLSNGTEAGTFSVDKLGDAMKEFGIRSKDTATTTTEGFELIGLNADAMRNKFSEGGETAKKATQETIDALFALDDKVIQNQAGVDLFGTMWEDLGAEGIAALSNVTGEADKTATTLKDIADIKYNDLGSQVEQLRRTIVTEMLEPIGEKALPKVKSGVDWIIHNLPEIKDEAKKLIPLITTAGSAFAAWKVASVALKGADAIKKFSSSVSAGNSVMKALNITMSANPAVAVTSAIVALTAAIVALSIAHNNEKTIADKIADSYKEERKKVDETRESINKLKDDFSSRAGEIDAESQRTEALWKELDKLTSATGRVRDADKDRAQYILGELNEALGTEYTMTGNQIDNYNKLTSSIEAAIEKKKALAYLDAYESKAGEMAELKTTSLENYQKYYADWQTAKAEMDAAAAEFKQKSGYDITEVNSENAGLAQGYEDILKRYETARATANENASLYQESKANYQSAVDYFTRLNDAEKAYADNAYSDIEGILYAQKDATKAALEDAKAADKEKEDALKKSISNSTIALKAAVETQSQAEIDAAFSTMEEMVRLAKEQNIDISQSFTEDFAKQVTEMIDAGFDISGLTKWGKESGIDVSKVFGKNYTKTVQDQLDKGYDITDLLAWGAASGIDISTEYADQYYQNVQNQLDQGYDITELLKWGAASGFDISKLFTEEFRDEFMNTLNDEQLGFYQWVLDNEETFRKMGHDLGWAFGDGFSSAYTQYIYSENNLIQSTVNSASDAKLRYNGKYATGGYISSGNTAVVAESGPELLEIMNGGVRVTPLTGAVRNTAVGAETAEQRTVLINNTIHVGKISNDYDVKTLAQSLAEEQRRIESGRGQR